MPRIILFMQVVSHMSNWNKTAEIYRAVKPSLRLSIGSDFRLVYTSLYQGCTCSKSVSTWFILVHLVSYLEHAKPFSAHSNFHCKLACTAIREAGHFSAIIHAFGTSTDFSLCRARRGRGDPSNKTLKQNSSYLVNGVAFALTPTLRLTLMR